MTNTHRTMPHEYSKVAWAVVRAQPAIVVYPDGKTTAPGVCILVNGKVRSTMTRDAARRLRESLNEVLEEEDK